MATKSGQPEPEKAEVVEELLDALDSALDRVKVLYEQYFLGIQKQPPTFLHTDVERKIRDITQIQVRNTALRYRFATLQQKFGSYNAYWRRTSRQIENGTYTRNLSKIGRQAARTGAEVPEEILAAMPRRMREQVLRDREQALALARLRNQQPSDDDLLTLADEEVDLSDLTPPDASPAFVSEAPEVRRDVRTADGALRVDEADADFDLDAFFAKVINEDAPEPAMNGHVNGARRPARPSPAVAVAHNLPTQPLHPTRAVTAASAPVRVEPHHLPTQPLHPAQAVTAAVAPVDPGDGDEPAQIYAPPMPRVAPPPVQTMKLPRPVVPPVIPPIGPSPSRPTALAGELAPSSGVPTVMPPLPSPRIAPPPRGPAIAPSQITRPNPIAPGASTGLSAPVESMSGPFPRIPAPAPTAPIAVPVPIPTAEATERTGPPRPPRIAPHAAQAMAPIAPAPPPARPPTAPIVSPRPPIPTQRLAARPPPPPPSVAPRPAAPAPAPSPPLPAGVSDADVSALYAKYVQAKQSLGDPAGPNAYGKLLKTIHTQAPKIMEQYNAKGVDFTVVVKDNQVVIRAKPKT